MTTPETVPDELALITRHVPVAGSRLLDLGCGNGALTRRLVTEAGAAGALGLDMEVALPADPAPAPGVAFRPGRAEALDVEDESFDGVLMLKSLHHVPLDQMDTALREAARVLRPGGTLYVSEPVARGPLDEIMRNFHDEAEVRAAAQEALARTTALTTLDDFIFLSPYAFADLAEFEQRMMRLPTLARPITPQQRDATYAAFAARAAADGSLAGTREFRVRVMQPR